MPTHFEMPQMLRLKTVPDPNTRLREKIASKSKKGKNRLKKITLSKVILFDSKLQFLYKVP